MVVGVARVHLRMPENGSLKDKRRIVRSLIDRARQRFNVAMAEVDAQDQRQAAVIGLCCVSGDRQHADRMLQTVTGWIDRQTHGQMTDCEIELW